MKALFSAVVNTTFLVAILAPVSLAIIWLVLSGLHASNRILYSGEALMLIPIIVVTAILFKTALKMERALAANADV